MRALLAGAERDLHEVRYVWVNDGVFVSQTLMMRPESRPHFA
jgi:hypothetical protein